MNTSVSLAQQFSLDRNSSKWPSALDELPEHYNHLVGIGDWQVLHEPCLGVVGARRATPYGVTAARMVGRIAAESGINVVSGGAMGCDFAASKAALDAGGKVILVSGCGPDVIYPRSSRELYERIPQTGGAIISCEGWGTPPRRYSFPKRNSVIAALSVALVVTEAGISSGTFSTAEAAVSLGRTLYAVPGSIYSPTSRGTNRLIEEGAVPVVDEVSFELRLSIDFGVLRDQKMQKDPRRGKIMSALVSNPARPDELAVQLDEDPLTLARTLVDYEAKGLVERLWDGRYTPTDAGYHRDDI